MTPSINLVAGDSNTHSTLSRGESIGLVFDAESGLGSIIAAFVILILVFVSLQSFLVNVCSQAVLSAGCTWIGSVRRWISMWYAPREHQATEREEVNASSDRLICCRGYPRPGTRHLDEMAD